MRLIDAEELDFFFCDNVFECSEQVAFAETIDAVPVVRCKDCVLHGNCLTEDTFNLCRIENPFCCGGKRKEADGNG